MSQRYLGGVITANPTAPTMTTESGVWTLEQQFQYSNVWSPKIVGNSLRFRSSASAYLNRTPASSGNQQKFTFSFWVKRGTLSTINTMFGINSASTNIFTIAFLADNTLRLFDRNAGSDVLNLNTTAGLS